MPSPFPGMDPYLEHPALWPDVHNSLIADLRNELAPQLLPRYYVALEERTYTTESSELLFVSRPDLAVIGPPTFQPGSQPVPMLAGQGVATIEPITVELPLSEPMRETYLEVRLTSTNEVITVVELLSPANKRSREGRQQYERKRLQVLDTLTHLVEIDLLRTGEPMPMHVPGRQNPDTHYRILISRAEQRPRADLLAFNLQQLIPGFYLPLQAEDQAPLIDLNRLLHTLYDRVGYQLRINYRATAEPPLKAADASWAATLLSTAGLH